MMYFPGLERGVTCEEVGVQGASSVCCRGREAPGWVAAGVLPHRDPGIQPYLSGALYKSLLSASWHSQPSCSSRAEPRLLPPLDHHPVPGGGPCTGGVAQQTLRCLTKKSQAPNCSQLYLVPPSSPGRTGRKADSGLPNTSP